jgi:hypothetical protein
VLQLAGCGLPLRLRPALPRFIKFAVLGGCLAFGGWIAARRPEPRAPWYTTD